MMDSYNYYCDISARLQRVEELLLANLATDVNGKSMKPVRFPDTIAVFNCQQVSEIHDPHVYDAAMTYYVCDGKAVSRG